MKQLSSNTVSYISKNILTIILVIALLLTLVLLYKTKSDLNKYVLNKDIDGTFIWATDNNKVHMPSKDTEYFTFMKGKFYRYKQFKLIEEGTYNKSDDNVYILMGENINSHIVYTNDSFYFYDTKENEIYSFIRMSDVPTFINLKID